MAPDLGSKILGEFVTTLSTILVVIDRFPVCVVYNTNGVLQLRRASNQYISSLIARVLIGKVSRYEMKYTVLLYNSGHPRITLEWLSPNTVLDAYILIA